MSWTLATEIQPHHGQFVEIGRIEAGKEVVPLDKVFWYPEAGNWNLNGMWWRPTPLRGDEE